MIIFRQFVMQETFPTEMKRPNFYTPTFFDIIKEAVQALKSKNAASSHRTGGDI